MGDALGAPVEFHTREQIPARFGPGGITACTPAYGGVGMVTDDTQMNLFTAEGLLRHWVRGRMRGLSTHAGLTASAYLRWLRTQGESPSREIGVGEPFDDGELGWLYQQRALHTRRAAGNTCMSALRDMRGLGEPADNASAARRDRLAGTGLGGRRGAGHRDLLRTDRDIVHRRGGPGGQSRRRRRLDGIDCLQPLEFRDVITAVADDLYEYPDWRLSEYDPDEETERICRKYPGY